MSRTRFGASPDELARIKARREARQNGFEYRPTTRAQADEAERLNEGLAQLENANVKEPVQPDEE